MGPKALLFFLIGLKCFLKIVPFSLKYVILRTVKNAFSLLGFCFCIWFTCNRAFFFSLLEIELSYFTFFINLSRCGLALVQSCLTGSDSGKIGEYAIGEKSLKPN